MPDRKEPTILWHYTDATGLLGIVSEQRLRCSNIRFLNDQTEHVYGWGLVRRLLQRFRCESSACAFVAGEAYRMMGAGEAMVVPHAMSFSELPDAMSQWQRYGNDGSGYAIGFEVALLRQFCSDHPTIARLARLVYGRRRQRSVVANRIASWHGGMPNHRVNGSESTGKVVPAPLDQAAANRLVNDAAVALALELSNIAMTLKHSDFEDEMEWRLITLSSRTQIPGAPTLAPTKFAVSRNYVKPYIETILALPEQPFRIPIVEVRCGPRLAERLATTSVRNLLDSHGFAHARVSVSRLKRTWR